MSNFKLWIEKMLIDANVKQDVNQDDASLVNSSKSTSSKSISKIIPKEHDQLVDHKLKILMENASKKKANIKRGDTMVYDTKEIAMLSSLQRDLAKKSITQKINDYDQNKELNDFRYKTYHETLDNELDAADENPLIDNEMDKILFKKLDVYVESNIPIKLSDNIISELNKQELLAEQRIKEHEIRVNALKALIKKNDIDKKINNEGYVSFEDMCLINEDDTAEEAMADNVRIIDKFVIPPKISSTSSNS